MGVVGSERGSEASERVLGELTDSRESKCPPAQLLSSQKNWLKIMRR